MQTSTPSHHHPSGIRCALQWKPYVNTSGYSMLSRSLSSVLLPQCFECSFNTVACFTADPARNTLDRSGLCWADLQRNRMGRVKDAHSSLNVSAFFGGGTDHIVFGTAAAGWRETGGDQNKTATLDACLLHLTDKENLWTDCYCLAGAA